MTRSQLSSKLQYVKCLLELWPFLTHKIVKDIAVSKAVASTSTVLMKQVAASSIIKKAYGMDWQTKRPTKNPMSKPGRTKDRH